MLRSLFRPETEIALIREAVQVGLKVGSKPVLTKPPVTTSKSWIRPNGQAILSGVAERKNPKTSSAMEHSRSDLTFQIDNVWQCILLDVLSLSPFSNADEPNSRCSKKSGELREGVLLRMTRMNI